MVSKHFAKNYISTMFMCDVIVQIHPFCSNGFCTNSSHDATVLCSYAFLTIYYGAFEYHGFEGCSLMPDNSTLCMIKMCFSTSFGVVLIYIINTGFVKSFFEFSFFVVISASCLKSKCSLAHTGKRKSN